MREPVTTTSERPSVAGASWANAGWALARTAATAAATEHEGTAARPRKKAEFFETMRFPPEKLLVTTPEPHFLACYRTVDMMSRAAHFETPQERHASTSALRRQL